MTSAHSHILPLAVLISGGGTTLRNLIEKESAGELPVEFKLVISSSPQAAGLAFAKQANLPSLVVEKNRGIAESDYSSAVFDPIRAAGVELVVMGGFLKHVPIPADFENRVINIHPALIPAFCGRGMYGLAVHQAALEYGVKVSGCTVHFVDNDYDRGPIILQHAVPVLDDDTPQTLQARVFEEECKALPEAIRLIAARRVSVEGRRVTIRPVM